jgi:hypothetical protein
MRAGKGRGCYLRGLFSDEMERWFREFSNENRPIREIFMISGEQVARQVYDAEYVPG